MVLASHYPQFATDLVNERPYDFHPEPFALVRLKVRRQPGTIVCDRYEMTMRRRRFESNDDPAFAVFSRIGDQLADNEAERTTQLRRDAATVTLDDDRVSRHAEGQEAGEILTKARKILLQLHGLLTVEKMQAPMDVSERQDAIGGDRQLSSRFC